MVLSERGGNRRETVVFTGSSQEAGSFSRLIGHHCLLEMIERRIRENRIIRNGKEGSFVRREGKLEGKSWSTRGSPERRGVSDDSESQGVEAGGGAAASELLAIYGSPFYPPPLLPTFSSLPRGRYPAS